MKKFLLALVAICAVFGVSAQRSSQSYLGIRAGVDVACPTPDRMTNGAGFNAGIIYNIPIYKMVYFEPGLSLYYDTYGIKHEDGSFRNWGFRIPLDFGLRVGLTRGIYLTPYTGPELNIGISNSWHHDNISVGQYGDDGGMHRFDIAWNFGVGLNYDRFYFGVGGAIGMCNLAKEGKMHMNRVSFNLGYNF